jgi:hypothetical protein
MHRKRVETQRHMGPPVAATVVGGADRPWSEPGARAIRGAVVERGPQHRHVRSLEPARLLHERTPTEGRAHAGMRGTIARVEVEAA